MKLQDKISAVLPQLTIDEIHLCQKDCHRAADVCAIGGGSSRSWYRYCECEKLFEDEYKRRNEITSFNLSFITPFDDKELEVLGGAWKKIRSYKVKKESKNGRKNEY